MFVKKKVFHGRYEHNLKRVKYMVQAGGIICIHYSYNKFNVPVIMPDNETDFDILKAIIDEQARIARRGLRKELTAIMYYVDDNILTRMLGFRETNDHIILAR